MEIDIPDILFHENEWLQEGQGWGVIILNSVLSAQ